MSYVIANDKPVLMPSDVDLWEVIEGLEDIHTFSSEEKPSSTADGIRWAQKIARQTGFMATQHFPVDRDGEGCHIIQRYESPEKCPEAWRDFEYIAFVNLDPEFSIIVGIPNVMALFQFYTLVRPMLMLQSEARFQDADAIKYMWDQGKPYKKMHQSHLALWEAREAKKKREAKNS